jgi:hypothetical protein
MIRCVRTDKLHEVPSHETKVPMVLSDWGFLERIVSKAAPRLRVALGMKFRANISVS